MMSRIAIVGNGPLTHSQQEEINKYSIVFRCNHMPSHRIGDKVTHLFVGERAAACPHVAEVSGNYIYFHRVRDGSPVWSRELKADPEKFLPQQDVRNVIQHLFELNILSLSEYEHEKIYEILKSREGVQAFTTGFNAVLYVLNRFPKASVDLYGFNWQGNSAGAVFDWELERDIVQKLKRCGRIASIHETAPGGYHHAAPLISVVGSHFSLQTLSDKVGSLRDRRHYDAANALHKLNFFEINSLPAFKKRIQDLLDNNPELLEHRGPRQLIYSFLQTITLVGAIVGLISYSMTGVYAVGIFRQATATEKLLRNLRDDAEQLFASYPELKA